MNADRNGVAETCVAGNCDRRVGECAVDCAAAEHARNADIRAVRCNGDSIRYRIFVVAVDVADFDILTVDREIFFAVLDSNAAVEAVNAGQVAISAGRQSELVVIVVDDVGFAFDIERAVRISFNRSILNVDCRVAGNARDLLNFEVGNINTVATVRVDNSDELIIHDHRTGRRDNCIFHAANVAGACDCNELAFGVDPERDVFVVVGEGQSFIDWRVDAKRFGRVGVELNRCAFN